MYEGLYYNKYIPKFTLNESLVETLLGFQGVSGTAHLKLNSTVAEHSQPLVKVKILWFYKLPISAQVKAPPSKL